MKVTLDFQTRLRYTVRILDTIPLNISKFTFVKQFVKNSQLKNSSLTDYQKRNCMMISF